MESRLVNALVEATGFWVTSSAGSLLGPAATRHVLPAEVAGFCCLYEENGCLCRHPSQKPVLVNPSLPQPPILAQLCRRYLESLNLPRSLSARPSVQTRGDPAAS